MGDENVKIRSIISISYAINSDFEETFEGPPRSVWDAMTEKERGEYLQEAAQTTLANNVEYYAEVVES